MKYFWIALKKYAVLEGRASRIEFWMFTLFWCIFCLIAVFLDVLLGTTIHGSDFGWITWTLILVLAIPSISIVFLLMAYNYYHQKKNKLYYFWIVMAVLFQPILKIALGRIVWNIIDVIIAVLLLLVLWKQNNEIKK